MKCRDAASRSLDGFKLASACIALASASSNCAAQSLVSEVVIDPRGFAPNSLVGSVAISSGGARANRPITLKNLKDHVWLDRLLDQRSAADATNRKLGWSSAMFFADWEEDWKTFPDGARAEDASLMKAIKNAAAKCLEAENDNEDLCMDRVLGPYADDVKAAASKLDICRQGYFDMDKSCVFNLESTDYENALFDPKRAPLSLQIKSLLDSNVDARYSSLNLRLTRLFNSIYEASPEGLSPCARQPVSVTIDTTESTDGLNVAADFCQPSLIIPQRIIEDIWARAIFRATRYYQTILSPDLDAFGNMYAGALPPWRVASAGDPSGAQTVIVTAAPRRRSGPAARIAAAEDLAETDLYSTSLKGYVDLVSGLPALSYSLVRSGDLAAAIRAAGNAPLLSRREGLLEILDSSPDDEIGSLLNIDEIQSLFANLRSASPDRRRDAALKRYLNERKELEQSASTGAENYSLLLSEALQISGLAEAEFYKACLFILAHESWHLWMHKYPSQHQEFIKEELDADAHAARMYLALAPSQGNTREILNTLDSLEPKDHTFSNSSNLLSEAALFETILGRDPDVILRELYAGTTYESGAIGHPPLELRVSALSALIADGREGLTRQKVDQMRCLLSAGIGGDAQVESCGIMNNTGEMQRGLDDDID